VTIPSVRDADLERRRRAIIWVGGAIAASCAVMCLLALAQGPDPEWPVIWLLVGLTALVSAITFAARRGHVRAAGAALTGTVLIGVMLGQLVRGQVGFAPFFIVVAVTLQPRDVLVTIGASVVGLAIMAVASRGYVHRPESSLVEFVNGVILFGLLASVAALMAFGVERLLGDLVRRDQDADRAHELALQSETRARLIAENTADLIALLDRQGDVVWASPSHQRVLGLTAEQVRQRDGRAGLVHPDDQPLMQAAFVAAAQGQVVRRQVRFKRADGTWGWFEALLSPVPGEPYVVSATRDITDLRALSAQLEASQKMEALGRLAGGVAHDFNNLLSVMQTCASLARADVRAGSRAAEDLDDLQGAIERATTLTRQLLAFSRREVVTPTRIDVGAVITPMVELVRRLLGASIDVRLAVTPGAWPVRAAPSQLEQVVMNLSVNARDAMPSGGVLELRVEPLRDDALGDVVRLSVKDTGSGMSEETKARIFEPFFTTKPAGRGTGLGLATVYGVVRSLGGRIDVETALGHGTEFRVLLPRAPDTAEIPQALAPAAGPGRQALRVFVVDDEPAVRALMGRVLAGHGLEVREFPSAEAALEALQGGPPLDVLVTDVMLPGIDGVRLAEAFLAKRPGLRVVLVSGFAPDPAATSRLVVRGARFLPKPFSPDALVGAVTQPPPKDEAPAHPAPPSAGR
jgi:PAS domain S-box-containing protein